jgi:hypothetical protein
MNTGTCQQLVAPTLDATHALRYSMIRCRASWQPHECSVAAPAIVRQHTHVACCACAQTKARSCQTRRVGVTSMHRQYSGQLFSPMRPEQGQLPLQHTYLASALTFSTTSKRSPAKYAPGQVAVKRLRPELVRRARRAATTTNHGPNVLHTLVAPNAIAPCHAPAADCGKMKSVHAGHCWVSASCCPYIEGSRCTSSSAVQSRSAGTHSGASPARQTLLFPWLSTVARGKAGGSSQLMSFLGWLARRGHG